MPNRLATESSLYLRQHAENPVDWFPWGPEAFAKAGSEQKPIFLSIGYSSCHWCHVMEHESFEDPVTAEFLNKHFVCVKVDREERPDVDEAYMGFVQLITGRGGWPTSVFMTADKRPFFGGTYWPNQDRHGYSGFRSICERIVQLWNEQRSDLLASADEYAAAMEQTLAGNAPAAGVSVDDALLVAVAEELEMRFDPVHGGFGSAPKFPPHSGIEFLLSFGDRAAPTDAVDMALFTLERMALGGIRDHVGGGFHRYSTDERWLLPHFEKMLYDNALLLGAYARASKLADGVKAALFARVVEELVGWATREMRAPQGYFYAALDADSEGEEGKFYVWRYEELLELPAGELFAHSYGARKSGNFADEASGKDTGLNVLHLSDAAHAASRDTLDSLLERRSLRPRPALDDKALVAWNGLMVAGLAEAGRFDLATAAADSILAAQREHGKLPHMIVGGKNFGSGFLEDYAFLAYGLVKLGRLTEANELMDEAVGLFGADAGFYGASEHHETLFGRTKPVLDQPIPSGNAVAIRTLVALERYGEAASALSGLGGWIARAPHGAEALSLAALEYLEKREPIAALDPIRVDVLFDRLADSVKGMLLLDIPEGWHLKGAGSRLQAICPTSVGVMGGKGAFSYPTDDTYEGQIRIPFRITEIPEGTEEVELLVGYQACTVSECLPPTSQAIRMRVGSR